MLFILLFVLGLLFFPKLFLNIILSISILIPSSHSSSAYKVELLGFNLSYNDVFLAALIIALLLKFIFNREKKYIISFQRKIVLVFLSVSFIYILIGILLYQNLSQTFYDSRTIIYYSLFLLNLNSFIKKKDLSSFIITFLVSLGLYSILCLTVFIFYDIHPYYEFFMNDNFISLGRITFQQDYLFIVAIPFLIYLLYYKNQKYKFLLVFLLVLFLSKVFIGMSRGLILLIILNIIPLLNFSSERLRYIKKSIFKNLIKAISLTLISIILLFNYFLPLVFKDSTSDVINYFSNRFLSFFSQNNESFISTHVDNRLVMWQDGLNQIIDSAFMGYGYGYTFFIDHPEWSNKPLSFIDSSFATLTLRSGILTLILFLLIYYIQRIKLKKIISTLEVPSVQLFIKCLYHSIPVLILFSLVNSYMVFGTSIFTLILMFSVINSVYEFK